MEYWKGLGRINGVAWMIQKSKQQQSQNGADRAEGHQSEAVVLCVFVASDGGEAHTHGHDKGNGHRAGGDASRIKSYGKEIFWYKKCQYKYQDIAQD